MSICSSSGLYSPSWKALTMGDLSPVGPIFRLGLLFGAGLIGVALLVQVQGRTTPVVSSDPAAALPNAQNVSKKEVSSAPSATAPVAAPSLTGLPSSESELPPQRVKLRQLQASFERGVALMQDPSSDKSTSEGAHLVNSAAALGFEPARMMIARDYPRSQIIRSVASSTEAVRYSLDPLFVSGRNTESGRKVLILLAAYFSGRHSIKVYAGDLLSALNENRHTVTDDTVKILLDPAFACFWRLHGTGPCGGKDTYRNGSRMLTPIAIANRKLSPRK